MKKGSIRLILLAMTAFVATHADAQYKFFTGGMVNYGSTTNSESEFKSTNYAFLPYVGYSATDNIIVGVALGYVGNVTERDADNKTSTGSFRVNPFARYRKQVGDKMGLYGEFGINADFGTEKRESQVGTAESNTTTFGAYIGPGIDYAFADRWVINVLWGALQYNSTSVKDVEGSTSQFAIGLDPSRVVFSLNFLF